MKQHHNNKFGSFYRLPPVQEDASFSIMHPRYNVARTTHKRRHDPSVTFQPHPPQRPRFYHSPCSSYAPPIPPLFGINPCRNHHLNGGTLPIHKKRHRALLSFDRPAQQHRSGTKGTARKHPARAFRAHELFLANYYWPQRYHHHRRLPWCSPVGDPRFRAYRLRLPPHLLHLLDEIVWGCEAHAATLPEGWQTDLYSLTRQDIALRDTKDLGKLVEPITGYIRKCMMALWNVEEIRIDQNQPHVLKYCALAGHTGVKLHHDMCDITANVCLSRPHSYRGGGTYFPDLQKVVRLDFGEFLLHPGALVHGGVNITDGTRHLLVLFAHTN